MDAGGSNAQDQEKHVAVGLRMGITPRQPASFSIGQKYSARNKHMHNILAREITSPDCHPQLTMSPFFHQGGWGKGAMSVEEAVLLHALVLNYKPAHILETGTENGYTAAVMGHACRENGFGSVTTIELHTDQAADAVHNINEVGLTDWVDVNVSDSLEFIGNLQLPVDFALIDSVIGLRLTEIKMLIPKMRKGSMIVTHDTAPNHPMRDVYQLQRDLDSLGYRVIHIPSPRGLSLIQLP
jgi:predicted O-methyltransferase YrrM